MSVSAMSAAGAFGLVKPCVASAYAVAYSVASELLMTYSVGSYRSQISCGQSGWATDGFLLVWLIDL